MTAKLIALLDWLIDRIIAAHAIDTTLPAEDDPRAEIDYDYAQYYLWL
jgi:hypothetical protein